MYKVTTYNIIEMTGENLSFNCETYEEYEFFYSFTFGAGKYQWSHSINKTLIKSIEKL